MNEPRLPLSMRFGFWCMGFGLLFVTAPSDRKALRVIAKVRLGRALLEKFNDRAHEFQKAQRHVKGSKRRHG